MAISTNINFHQTFKPEKQYIASILEIADGSSKRDIQTISSLTGIPNGKSSGKVEPHICYAEYMGLVVFDKKNGEYIITKTHLGEIVSDEDPGLQENLTITLLHAMMCRKLFGAGIWEMMIKQILPKYHNSVCKDIAIKELNTHYEGKVSIKNFAPFIGSYDDLFSKLQLISISGEDVSISSMKYDSEFIYLYAFILFEYWDELFEGQAEISSIQLEELSYGKVFGWGETTEYTVLERLAEKEIIRMNRQLMPYTILRLVDKEDLIVELYSELC